MTQRSLRREVLNLAAIAGAACLYFAKAEPWTDCASRAVEVREFGRAIIPSEGFMLPHDHLERMENVRLVNRDIREGRVPGYVVRQCGPKPDREMRNQFER
jgi:predicted kinase